MLKEFYYDDQSDFDSSDYIYLYRFISRMIEYRDSSKGSYDGRKRMEEIKRIDVSRLTEMTKRIFVYCIYSCDAQELLSLKNLQELKGVTYDPDLINRLRRRDGMKLNVNEFYENVKKLNHVLEEQVRAGRLPEDYMFEIRCIGGFAMSYWKLRDNGMTEDMDSLTEISDAVREAIRMIAEEDELPYDWINDTMLHFYSEKDFQWIEVPWFFGKNARIRVFVCSKEDLLRTKAPLAEHYLSGGHNQDRTAETDYYDTLSILESFGVTAAGNPAFNRYRMETLGIGQKYFPMLYRSVLGESDADDTDELFFRLMDSAQRGMISAEEFLEKAECQFGYKAEEIKLYYGPYLEYFPAVKTALSSS